MGTEPTWPASYIDMSYINFFVEQREVFLGVHIVSALVGTALALTADTFFARVAKDKMITKEEGMRLIKISKYIWIAVGLILVSGVGVFLSDISYYLRSVKFLSKMTVVSVIALNGFLLYKLVQPYLLEPGFLSLPEYSKKRRLAVALGGVSLVSWVSAISLAFLNYLPTTYFQTISLYLVAIVLAVLSAIFLENKFSRK